MRSNRFLKTRRFEGEESWPDDRRVKKDNWDPGQGINMDVTVYMPDGNGGLQPVPEVLLESELVRFLRLRELGVRNPKNTLRYYREIGALKPTKIGNRNCYTVQAAIEFLEKLTKK